MVRWIWTVGLLLGFAPGASAAPVGMACHLTGKPEVRAMKQSGWKPLRLLQRLEPGDTVRCGLRAEAVIVLFGTGERFQVGGRSEATVQAASVQGAKSLGKLNGPSATVAQSLAGSRVGAVVARPVQRAYDRLVSAPNGWLVSGERLFEWRPVTEAAWYTFTLFDVNDNVLWSQRANRPRTEYPEYLRALDPKKPYLWRVSSFDKMDRPLAEGRWGVLTVLERADSERLLGEVTVLRQQAQERPDDATPLALLAEHYRELGVLGPAIETLEELRRYHPASAEPLLDELFGQLGGIARGLAGRSGAPESGE